MLFAFGASAQEITEAAKERAASLVKQMTLDEKLEYIGGYNSFYIRAIPRLGIPEIKMSDGPQGVRNDTKSTLYPSGIVTASTWNRDLARKVGEQIGSDCRARGVGFILGPGVNMYRSPLCGRNFEYFGEDPYLASETAVQYIEGVQGKGVIATVKHFCGNNEEWDRHNVSSEVDERTLQELYLTTFRKAVEEAKVGAVMSSYNMLNGQHMTENPHLIQDIMRGQWGFQGIYMSDWNATYTGIAAANAGLDLEMPSGKYMNPEALRKAIGDGVVDERTIDEKVQHILQTLIAFGMFDRPQKDTTIPLNDPKSDEVALEVAREGIVLLKNDDGVLPLGKGKYVVMGPNADHVAIGGGSGAVHPITTVTFAQAFDAMGKKYKSTLLVSQDGASLASGESRKAIASADAVVYCAGLDKSIEREGSDRSYGLPAEQIEMMDSIAAINPNLIVVMNCGGAVDFGGWASKAKAIVYAMYPGQEGGKAVAEIITGKVNPSGKLAYSISKRIEDEPCYDSYHETSGVSGFRKTDLKKILYAEGLFTGYRGYDRNGVAPLYPFGYGMSYTTFGFSNLKVKKAGKKGNAYTISFDISNTGKTDGAEVAQVYVGAVDPKVVRPVKELKGYEKVYLKKGEKKNVKITLSDEAFHYYDVVSKQFVVAPGDYRIFVGSSSRDTELGPATVTIAPSGN